MSMDKKKDQDPVPAQVTAGNAEEAPLPKPKDHRATQETAAKQSLVQQDDSSLSETQKQKAIQSVLAKMKKMNKSKDFEKVSNMHVEKKENVTSDDGSLTQKEMDKTVKKVIKQNIPHNLSEKKSKQEIKAEQKIQKEATSTLSESLNVIAEAEQRETKLDTPEEKRRVAI